jgi:hypothetical protein
MNALITFKKNVADVDRLINFDKEVLQVAIQTMEELHKNLKDKFASDQMNGGRALTIIKGIRDNESLRSRYAAIFNQAVVLLVSHFASALGDLFRDAVSARLDLLDDGTLLSEEVKLTFSDIKDQDWNLRATAPDLLIAKYDFTFQDMQSTVRAFEKFAGITLQRDSIMNNIITAQACRHVIAHAGGKISERTIKQVLKAKPRTLKVELTIGESVQFEPKEIVLIMKDMTAFVENVSSKISTESSVTQNASTATPV